MLKGEQSALDSDPELFSVRSQVRAGWDADLQIVALPGSPTDVRVPLDLRVVLSAAFLTSDLLSQTSLAVNTFSATLAPHPALGSASVPFTQVGYDYDWLRRLGTDEFGTKSFPASTTRYARLASPKSSSRIQHSCTSIGTAFGRSRCAR